MDFWRSFVIIFVAQIIAVALSIAIQIAFGAPWVQIIFIAIGVLIITFSVLSYFLCFKSSFFVAKRITEYLDENERIKYQKATAIPNAVFGISFLILGVFFWNQVNIFKIGIVFSYLGWFVSTLIINKIHLGYFFALSVPKKIF